MTAQETVVWRVLATGAGEPALNMALDEALLEAAAGYGRPTLRFYDWSQPAATFGYFQHYDEIAAFTQLRPLIRRPTGGGLVPHDGDWTYSVAVPPQHSWYRLTAVDSYRRLHDWLRRALSCVGLETSLAPCCDPSGKGQCFVGAERFDLLWQGSKIAGAAQRRNRLGLLIQGSVQPRGNWSGRTEWEAAMVRVGSGAPDHEAEEFVNEALDSTLLSRARELVAEKYGREEYQRRR